MNASPTETLIKFPCQFAIKAIGKSCPDFVATVLAIIRQYSRDITEDSFTTRLSKGSKYTAITITITATDQKQLDNIYQDLHDCPAVVMTL